MLRFIKCAAQLREFKNLPKESKKIVFYSEGHTYWVHFEEIIHNLIQNFNQTICYITSQEDDPILKNHHPKIIPFYIGEGMIRTLFFKNFEEPMMILTMPDLEKYHLKRSIHPVHYTYIYHSLVSTHMIYRNGAFNYYDTIFCAGPHHVEEIRQTEKIYGLKAKNLIEHGYGRLDSIYAKYQSEKENISIQSNVKKRILIGPSWGVNNIFESVGHELISILLNNGYHVTIRPHPHALKIHKKLIVDIIEKFKNHPEFAYDLDVTCVKSLYSSDVLITDWSGIAFDYAFGLEKPIVFLDVPPKINNPEFTKLSEKPIEDVLRSLIGELVTLDQIEKLPGMIENLLNSREKFLSTIKELRSAYVYNFTNSGLKGAQAIMALATSKLS